MSGPPKGQGWARPCPGMWGLERLSGWCSGVAAVAEVIATLLGAEAVEQPAQHLPQGLDGSGCGLAEQPLELAEGQFDGVEVRAVRRQGQYTAAPPLDQPAPRLLGGAAEGFHGPPAAP